MNDLTNAITNAITIIDDFIINANGGETLTFTVAIDDNHNLPVVDVSIKDTEGIEVAGDLNFETFEDALIQITKLL